MDSIGLASEVLIEVKISVSMFKMSLESFLEVI